ncbi:MAG TPA: uL22 family ribosomal protein [Candidatus Woesebacteria bacterium]|mgnify:CR=1 FL=1|nr:uL22 family ribosomal protein [Candidatus Woesebacteria bacterium]
MAKEIKKTTKIKTPAIKKSVVKKDIKKAEIKAVSKVVETPKVEVSTTKIVKYFNKDLMISPRKLRLLANDIKKLSPTDALNRLKFTNTKSARIMIKALQNVIADAKNNFSLDTNTLKFDLIKVDEGLKMKRMDKAHGSRFARGLIQKRHSRLIIHVKGNQK